MRFALYFKMISVKHSYLRCITFETNFNFVHNCLFESIWNLKMKGEEFIAYESVILQLLKVTKMVSDSEITCFSSFVLKYFTFMRLLSMHDMLLCKSKILRKFPSTRIKEDADMIWFKLKFTRAYGILFNQFLYTECTHSNMLSCR